MYWGGTSFSIRARIATEEREYASFCYGYPPNTMEIYLKQLPLDENESAAFRQELLKSGIFKEAGKWTLRATVDKRTRQKAEQVYKFVIDRAAEILNRKSQSN
jgi:hypothetical protein